jgi:hypothetical protein
VVDSFTIINTIVVKEVEDGVEKDVVKEIGVGILDFYNHLDYLGKNATRTVIEASIYGHAYWNGPIIMNTYDNSKSFRERDKFDLDGRAKDWIQGGPTMTKYSSLKDAFHTSGEFRIWGCSHMKNVIEECNIANQRAQRNTPRTQPFIIPRSDGGEESGTLDSIKCSIAQYISGEKIRYSLEHGDATGVVSYPGAAAQFLGIPCFSSPVGAGSENKKNPPPDEAESVVAPNGENRKLSEYYTREFGTAFVTDNDGYMNYTTMLTAQLQYPGWYTSRWIRYRHKNQDILRLPSGLELYRTNDSYEYPISRNLGLIAGHLYVAPSCRPGHIELRQDYRVLILDPAIEEDCGVWVLADGRSILMRRIGARGVWRRNDDSIEIWTMRLVNFGDWTWQEDTGVTRTTIYQGLLEDVQPKWYW